MEFERIDWEPLHDKFVQLCCGDGYPVDNFRPISELMLSLKVYAGFLPPRCGCG